MSQRKFAFTAVLTAAAIGLSACGSDTSSSLTINDVPGTPGTPTPSRILFDPGNGVLPIPNDLLFSGTTDGTIEAPDEVDAREAGEGFDYGDPAVALGAVDGWSTLMPLRINLAMAEGATIDAATVNGDTVIMIETITPPVDGTAGSCQIPNLSVGLPCGVAAPLTYGVDYVAVAGDNSITVAPRAPLKEATTYVVALAPGILDSRGEAVSASQVYEGVSANDFDIAFAGLDSLQDAINLYEVIVAMGTGGNPAAPADMLYSSAWTTTSVNDPVVAATGLLLNTPPGIVGVTDTTLSVEAALIGAGVLPPAAAGTTPYGSVSLYQAQVTLPYYSGTPADGSDPLRDNWRALCDNPLVVAEARAAGAPAVEPANTICSTINPALGDYGLDSERHLTKYNPVPASRDNVAIAVQMTVPDAAEPPGGWPVVIMQHGITSNKEAMLLLTAALSQAGFATFAIDLPLHGSRGLASAAQSGAEANAGTDATAYMNLSQLLVARDNFSQSVADIIGLRAAINNSIAGALSSANFDTSQVHFVGMSLGGMVGVGATAIVNNLGAGLDFDSVVYAVPGGGIVPLLVESGSFGPLVQGSVLAAAGVDLSSQFIAFVQSNAGCAGDLGCNFTEFTATLDAAGLATIQAIITQFTFAAQTIVDSIDPNNAAADVVTAAVPVMMQAVVGDGVNSLPDQVIPNLTNAVPFGGTEPLARFLGLSAVDTTNGPAASGLVRFVAGSHGSLLDPSSSAAATTEMQTLVATFLAAGVVNPTDPAVVAPAP